MVFVNNERASRAGTGNIEAAGFGSVIVTPHADQVVINEDRIPEVALTSVRIGGVREALRDADQQTLSERSPRSRKPCAPGSSAARCVLPEVSFSSPVMPDGHEGGRFAAG